MVERWNFQIIKEQYNFLSSGLYCMWWIQFISKHNKAPTRWFGGLTVAGSLNNQRKVFWREMSVPCYWHLNTWHTEPSWSSKPHPSVDLVRSKWESIVVTGLTWLVAPSQTRNWQSSNGSVGVVLTEALGGVKNLQVTDPTTSSLKVRWEPAEGNVRQYRIFYVPATGGAEDMVRQHTNSLLFITAWILCFYQSRWLHQSHLSSIYPLPVTIVSTDWIELVQFPQKTRLL